MKGGTSAVGRRRSPSAPATRINLARGPVLLLRAHVREPPAVQRRWWSLVGRRLEARGPSRGYAQSTSSRQALWPQGRSAIRLADAQHVSSATSGGRPHAAPMSERDEVKGSYTNPGVRLPVQHHGTRAPHACTRMRLVRTREHASHSEGKLARWFARWEPRIMARRRGRATKQTMHKAHRARG